MTQTLIGVMTGVYTACQSLYASSTAPDGTPVLVSFGDPGQYQPSAIVAVMDVQPSQIARPTLGTNRSRELACELSVLFSVYTPGGPEAYAPCLTSVTALELALENYLRVSPNESFGGTCRDSWISAISGPTGSIAYDPESVRAGTPSVMGRVVELTATLTALIRY